MLAVLLAGTAANKPAALDPQAMKVIAQTRTTKATYSLYGWNTIRSADGRAIEEWSAEFHSGVLHRVETPRDRVVADCAEMTGSHFNIETGAVTTGERVARVACGIADTVPAERVEFQGRRKGRFGLVRRVRVVDQYTDRTYDVDARGAIVEETLKDRSSGTVLHLRARAISASVPKGIFGEESLRQSAVPAQYRIAPN